METSKVDKAKALDGKIFAMLTEKEKSTLEYFRQHGRKYGVSVRIISDADTEELATAKSKEQADEILKSSNSKITVTVN